MKKIFLTAVAIMALAACNKTLIENPIADSEYGYINLGITADDEMEVVTKAESEAGNSYRVKLEGKVNSANFSNIWNVSGAEGVLGDGWVTYEYLKNNASELLTVPAGQYKITAENIAQQDIYNDRPNGQMYVSNTPEEFSVTSGKPVTKNIECKIQNSKVVAKKGTDFDQYFRDAEITISAKTSQDATATTFKMLWTSTGDTQTTETTASYSEVYLPANTSVIWTLTAKLVGDSTNTVYTYTNSGVNDAVITTEQGKCTTILLTPRTDGNGVVSISITTNESYDTASGGSVVLDPLSGSTSN